MKLFLLQAFKKMSENDEIIEDFSGMTQVNGVVVNPGENHTTGNTNENKDEVLADKYKKYTQKNEQTEHEEEQGEHEQHEGEQQQDQDHSENHFPQQNANIPPQKEQIQPKIGILDQIKRIGTFNIIMLIGILCLMFFLGWKYLKG